ncbi:MAG: hypothetical protein JRJ85_11905 [Deltaproteobacteria bacterium]|nr:hypothetical protein [Deltaproteobacteria bacterium]
MKYYMASKGVYASSVKLINCLIALIIMAVMGFAALPSFLMVQANASKEITFQSSGTHLAGLSSNRVSTGPSYPSIHSNINWGAQKSGQRGLRISRGYKKRVKHRPIVKNVAPGATKKVHFADYQP